MAWYEEEHYEAPVSESLFHPERLEHLRCHQILRYDYPRTYRRTEPVPRGLLAVLGTLKEYPPGTQGYPPGNILVALGT